MKRPKGIRPMIPARPSFGRPKGGKGGKASKPKRKKRPGSSTVLALRGSPSWAAWLRDFARHENRPIAEVVEIALFRLASDFDFRSEMPERLARIGRGFDLPSTTE